MGKKKLIPVFCVCLFVFFCNFGNSLIGVLKMHITQRPMARKDKDKLKSTGEGINAEIKAGKNWFMANSKKCFYLI